MECNNRWVIKKKKNRNKEAAAPCGGGVLVRGNVRRLCVRVSCAFFVPIFSWKMLSTKGEI
jgi:hypothetical protein